MNLLHVRYAVEIARTNSINRAGEVLYVGPSALSRAVKDLEAELGVTLFERTSRGMFLTPDGERFISYAKEVLKQADALENMFRKETPERKRFSVSVPSAAYLADAFSSLSLRLGGRGQDLVYYETNSMQSIRNVAREEYDLGILRCPRDAREEYVSMLRDKGIVCRDCAAFSYVVLFGKDSPLREAEQVSFSLLQNLTEITHADPFAPSSFAEKKGEPPRSPGRRMFVFDRSCRLETLGRNPETYLWSSPLPEHLLKLYGLEQRSCDETLPVYLDLLIHREEYALSRTDRLFLEEVEASRQSARLFLAC